MFECGREEVWGKGGRQAEGGLKKGFLTGRQRCGGGAWKGGMMGGGGGEMANWGRQDAFTIWHRMN